MAKQRGPHQLSGKINNLCYYTQKGVRGGLVRRINDGMSERLKVGEEFANTRRANSVFGMCSMFAGQILNQTNARNIYLFRADRQAIFTKKLFEYYKKEVGFDTNSSFSNNQRFQTYLARIFDDLVKNKFSNFFSPVADSFKSEDIDFSLPFSLSVNELTNFCNSLGCIGVSINFNGAFNLYPPYREGTEGSFELGALNPPRYRPYNFNWFLGDDEFELVRPMTLWDDGINLAFIKITPIVAQIGERVILSQSKAICKMFTIYF